MPDRVFLVTGASGFIGRALCRTLQPMGRVRALLHRPVSGPWHEALTVDLAQAAPPIEVLEGVDAVFHLAGKAHAVDEGREDDGGHHALTVDGTRRLLEACRRARVPRLVFVSSVKAMGEGGERVLDESAIANPRSAYGRSKRAAEVLVLDGGYVAHASVLRLPLVYGPGQKGNLMRMIEAVDRGQFPSLPRVHNRRAMIHADDVARAALLAADNPAASGRVFIVSDGRESSPREIYQWICAELRVQPPAWTMPLFAFRILAATGEVVRRVSGRRWRFDADAYHKLFGSAVYDTSAARDVLGLVPEWDLRRAMPELVDDFKRRGTDPKLATARAAL
jgi:nucleoside-diphosphate-sugar epimerase